MDILIKPLISEKAMFQMENLGKYSFVVNPKANKIQIRNAVEDMYGVTVESVNTSILPRKTRSRFTRSGVLKGKTKLTKKAVVSLVEGDTIDFFESV